MKMLGSLAAVAALLIAGNAEASGPTPHAIFDEAMAGEFGEILRVQALLEHVCDAPASAALLGGHSQKALAPFMPPLTGVDEEEWRRIAVTVYNLSLQYRLGYAAGVHRGLDVVPEAGQPTPTARLCQSALGDAKRWMAR